MSVRRHKNVDSFYAVPPGSIEEITCRACGTACHVDRDQIGPTGYISAMGKAKTPHDHWYCPYSEHEWHRQLVRMYLESVNTSSPSVAKLIRADMKELREQHIEE